MKSFTFGKRGIAMLSLVASLFVGGTTAAFAETATFENSLPEGWETVGNNVFNSDRGRRNSTGYGNAANVRQSENMGNYLTTTKLEGTVSFWMRANSNNNAGYVIIYELNDDNTVGNKLATFDREVNTYKEMSFTLESPARLAIAINCAWIDDMTYTEYVPTEGPILEVKDGASKIKSPYSYDFGLTSAGVSHEFTLSNPGTEDFGVTVSETGEFSATLSSTTIAAGSDVTLTVTMPTASASSTITITPAAEGIEPFVINVTGAVKDPSKFFMNFADGLSDSWVNNGWTIEKENAGIAGPGTSGGGYAIQQTSVYNNYRLVGPMMTYTENEPLVFLAAAKEDYENHINSYTNLKIQYSVDGTTWTDVKTLTASELTKSWKSFTANMPAGSYYVAFYGAYVYLTDIYGGVEATEFPPVMEVEEKDYDFGFIAENAEYKFTIKNTGKGDLTGLEVTSDNAAFTIAGVPENKTIAAESEIEITVTMVAEGEGAKNGVITISADAYKDENAKKFNVTGIVRNPELFYEGFDAEPAGWRMEGYSVENGYAKGPYDQGTLVTPSLSFANHNTLSFRAMSKSSTALSFRVFYTTNSQNAADEEWKEIEGVEPLSTFDKWETYTLNMPAEAKYVAFLGEYINIDDVYGGELLKQTLTLDQTVAPEALAEGMCDVTLNYTIAEGKWGTIALPFAVEDLSVLGDVKAYAFTGYENGNIKLDVTTTMEAGKPYVIYANAAISEAIELNNVNITATEAAAVEFNGAKFQATYAPLAAGSMEGKYGVAPTGKIQKGSAKASMKGFRGFFELPANAQNARLLINGEEVTGIEAIENAESADVVFDLQGRRVAQPTKGLYIIGGKKMMVK